VLAAAEAMAQCTAKSIPLPDAALLTPSTEFICALQTATPNAAPSQLDYERQCYRDAGVVLRDRLLKLQASVGETVKAINRACPAAVSAAQPGSKPSIPLPRHALLTPPPNLDCAFKDSADAADSAAKPTPAEAIAAVRMKLDYERQCYRHNEIILLNDLDQLQAAVGETIKAVTGNDRSAASAAKQQPAAKQSAAATQQSAPKLQSATATPLPAAKPQSAAAAQQPAANGNPAAKQQPAAKQSAAAPQQPAAKQQSAAATQQPLAMQQPAAMQEQAYDRPPRILEAPCAGFSRGRCVGRDPDARIRSMMSHDSE
jgi:hypothetical protein